MLLAITHVPSPKIGEGLRTHTARVAIDYNVVLRQHQEYSQTLRQPGPTVITLDVNRQYPDSVFIEDTAIALDELAVLTSMGAAERRAEPLGIEPVLRGYRDVQRVTMPASIEGGDVLQIGRTLLVGLSSRTNVAGVAALDALVRRHGYQVKPVPVRDCLHLKTACTALPDGTLLVNPSWLELKALDGFNVVRVPANEPWAANTLTVNGTVLLAGAHEATARLLRRRGMDVETIDVSELAKAEGSVTCLSLMLTVPQIV